MSDPSARIEPFKSFREEAKTLKKRAAAISAGSNDHATKELAGVVHDIADLIERMNDDLGRGGRAGP